MSKKNKQFNKDFSNEAPEVYNTDDIGYMSDESVHDRMNRLENERSRLFSMGHDTFLWEVELAYLQREQQLRQTRAEKHAEFMNKFMSNARVDEITENLASNTSVDENSN